MRPLYSLLNQSPGLFNVKTGFHKAFSKIIAPSFNGKNLDVRRAVKGDFKHIAPRGPFAIYFHIPFCESYCRDCPYSKSTNKDLMEKFCEHLLLEMDYVAENFSKEECRLNSVFFGGGTPSILPMKYLEKIMKKLQDKFISSKNAYPQITFEVHPNSFDLNNLQAIKDMGINRMSLGIQSFHNSILKEMKRNYDSAHAKKIVDGVSKFGYDFNIDLMFGFSCDNTKMFLEDIQTCVDMGANHVSTFNLVRKQGTKEADKMLKRQGKMYKSAVKLFKDLNFVQYRIADFSRDEDKKSLYNIDLTCLPTREKVVFGTSGFGSAADGGEYSKIEKIETYISYIKKQIPPVNFIGDDEDRSGLKEAMVINSLEAISIDREGFKKQFGVDPITGTEIGKALYQYGILTGDKKEMRIHKNFLFNYGQILNDSLFLQKINPPDPKADEVAKS